MDNLKAWLLKGYECTEIFKYEFQLYWSLSIICTAWRAVTVLILMAPCELNTVIGTQTMAISEPKVESLLFLSCSFSTLRFHYRSLPQSRAVYLYTVADSVIW